MPARFVLNSCKTLCFFVLSFNNFYVSLFLNLSDPFLLFSLSFFRKEKKFKLCLICFQILLDSKTFLSFPTICIFFIFFKKEKELQISSHYMFPSTFIFLISKPFLSFPTICIFFIFFKKEKKNFKFRLIRFQVLLDS